MQVGHATVLPNTVTPFTGAKPAAPATNTYTPSFPPVEQPSALDQARHSPANPLVYTAKPAVARQQPSTGEKSEPAATRSDGVGDETEVVEEREDSLSPIGQSDSGQQEKDEGQGSAFSGLDEQELQELRELAARDREVRTHEQAHARVGGKYAGAPVYAYERGPDGASYAVSGEVPIDVAPIPGDPEATIQKMRQVHRAALAPAEPSGQDRAVAAMAARQLLEAQAELMKSRAAKFASGETSGSENANSKYPGAAAGEAGAAETGPQDFAALLGIETYLDVLERGRLFQEQGWRSQSMLDVVA